MNTHYDLAAAMIAAGADPGVADHTGMNALYEAVNMVSFVRDVGRPLQPQFGTLKAIDLVAGEGRSPANPEAQMLLEEFAKVDSTLAP